MTDQLQTIIDKAWEDRANMTPAGAPAEVRDAVEHVIVELNSGRLRVASRESAGKWTTHQWIKKAVLLSFRLTDNAIIKAGDLGFYDKVTTKFAHLDADAMNASGVDCTCGHQSRAAQLTTAGAVIDRKPATIPIAKANSTVSAV